jgi:hypothetical protein
MLEVRLYDFSRDDRDRNRCDCGRKPYAIMEAENVKIGFCEECLKETIEQFKDVQNTIEHTCSHCKHFKKDDYDFEIYGGKCLIQEYTYKDTQGNERTANKEVDHLGTCDKFEK